MDRIFKALADPARRALLDALRDRDGQTLTDLETRFEMSRFGVMKHLRVLEGAGLVTTHKAGRFKYHYLNAVPLQQVIDRWIDPLLVKPAARAALDLKSRLEGASAMDTPTKPDFVMTTFIRCTQDALWQALSDPDAVRQFHFMASHAEMRGDAMVSYTPDGAEMLVCRVTEATPMTRLVTTFEPKWDAAAVTSTVVYLIAPEGDHCRLTIQHYGLQYGADGVGEGWARWASGLKTWLETGTPARFGAAVSAA
ncbi:ArsR family transcriptional regulator [Meridianimarinicoccus roseus]|uniref:ArsR family transcriptional regulator n=1 Tax=Meridianimarinicoccus roseus TaxID=2072018 RepID=A0A2V2LF23_9RHOB|nr:metalloregulator ArsR/SmtB family transcription factor [Meridianimarinicoccus roseus]PWR04200.1 ArsR family transcriptional regulator [Meridianimarinicoccus roseus]